MNCKTRTLIKRYCCSLLLIFFISCLFISCEENPNTLGITLITSDTTTTRVLDSQNDTMPITSRNFKKFINTSASKSILVGNYKGYVSKPLLKFSSIGPEFDSAKVISAVLTLRYNEYFFKDEMGMTSFNVFRVNTNLNFSTITVDSVNSSSIGTVSMGSYSGSPVDTQTVTVNLNNDFVKDWLEYAADTNYVNKNYGFMLSPDITSSTIKGFYSYNNTIDLIPTVKIIILKNSTLDTLNLVTSQYVTLSDAPSSIIPPERFVLQNGVAYRNILNFDLSKLPSNVIINNATLTFTLDNTNSYINSLTNKGVRIGMVIDSTLKTDSLFNDAFLSDSVTYVISTTDFNKVFQRWNSGILPNLGITMRNIDEIQNIDNFIFYSPTASDITKRPRLKITYTLRN